MNSSIEIAEAVKLASKLIDRTREGRLTWEASLNLMKVLTPADLSGATAFSTTLEGNLKAMVSIGKQGQMASLEEQEELAFSLVEFAPKRVNPFADNLLGDSSTPDKVILSVSVEKDPSFGYDNRDEMRLSGLLIDLYELARRSALKIDGSVEKALSYLDRIAV